MLDHGLVECKQKLDVLLNTYNALSAPLVDLDLQHYLDTKSPTLLEEKLQGQRRNERNHKDEILPIRSHDQLNFWKC